MALEKVVFPDWGASDYSCLTHFLSSFDRQVQEIQSHMGRLERADKQSVHCE
jgi:hypothetical protein